MNVKKIVACSLSAIISVSATGIGNFKGFSFPSVVSAVDPDVLNFNGDTDKFVRNTCDFLAPVVNRDGIEISERIDLEAVVEVFEVIDDTNLGRLYKIGENRFFAWQIFLSCK